jgi:hypothetical protein
MVDFPTPTGPVITSTGTGAVMARPPAAPAAVCLMRSRQTALSILVRPKSGQCDQAARMQTTGASDVELDSVLCEKPSSTRLITYVC